MRILITCLVGTTLILCLVGKKFIFDEGNIKRTEAKEDNLNSRNRNAAAFNFFSITLLKMKKQAQNMGS